MTIRGDERSAVDEIARVRSRWVAAINQADPDGFASLVGEACVWAAPGAVLSGRSEIREWLRGPFQRFEYEYTVSNIRIHAAAGWALERSDFESIVRERGVEPARTHRGTYTMTWRRSGDAWLIDHYVDEVLLTVAE